MDLTMILMTLSPNSTSIDMIQYKHTELNFQVSSQVIEKKKENSLDAATMFVVSWQLPTFEVSSSLTVSPKAAVHQVSK